MTDKIFKYKTGFGSKISKIEVERETESSVWIRGNRNKKMSSYERYHDSWEAAHSFLLAQAEIKLEGARFRLHEAQGYHGNVKGMKNPEVQS